MLFTLLDEMMDMVAMYVPDSFGLSQFLNIYRQRIL